MTFRIETALDGRALIFVAEEGFNLDAALARVPVLRAFLDKAPAPLVVISDTSNYEYGFADLMIVLSEMALGPQSVLSHPNLAGVILVSTSSMLRLGEEALREAPLISGTHVQILPTLEQALAHAQTLLET